MQSCLSVCLRCAGCNDPRPCVCCLFLAYTHTHAHTRVYFLSSLKYIHRPYMQSWFKLFTVRFSSVAIKLVDDLCIKVIELLFRGEQTGREYTLATTYCRVTQNTRFTFILWAAYEVTTYSKAAGITIFGKEGGRTKFSHSYRSSDSLLASDPPPPHH